MFRRRCGRAAIAGVLLLSAACSGRPDPIIVEEHGIVVQNTTSRDWKNVLVTVNDHFTGGVQLLSARGRMNAPLSQFRSAFGQRYDPSRQSVYKVEVTATDTKGEAVSLRWGRDKGKGK